jgi:UDP-N-acetylmuramate dehydrogenase
MDDLVAKISKSTYFPHYDVANINSSRLSQDRELIHVKCIDDLKIILAYLNSKKITYEVISGGSNFIPISNKLIVFIDFDYLDNELKSYQKTYTLSATTPLGLLTSAAIKHHIKGWEVFTGIPATLGGAIYMNAGTRLGEIGELIEWVDVVDNLGRIKRYKKNELNFSYRSNHFIRPGEVIISAGVTNFGQDDQIPKLIQDYIQYRHSTQPWRSRNSGCVYKNPSSNYGAGLILDLLNLKGLTYKELKISDVHSNFIENINQASSLDYLCFTSGLKILADLYSPFMFELEVKCL